MLGKKKFIPKIHEKQMIFERKGFIDQNETKRLIKEEVTFYEGGVKFIKDMDEDGQPKQEKIITNINDFKKISRKQYAQFVNHLK